MLKKRILGVAGAGHVGAHVAFCLGMMGIADEVRLCDVKEQKMVSEVQDLNDAILFMPGHTTYKEARYEDLADCDILINAVGDVSLSATGNRDDETSNSVKEVAAYIPKVMAAGFHGIIISITNPCDVIAHLVWKLSGLPKGHVFGTGTLLDSARLVHAIEGRTHLDPKSFFAFMMGEHGASQMVPWSCLSFFGQPLSHLEEDPRFAFDKDKVQETAIKGGWVTYMGKQCTEYGIASAAATLARAVLRDEKRILPASVPLDGEYGESGVFCGVPSVIGADGVEEVMEYPLTPAELTKFKTCVAAIRTNMAKAEAMLGK